jgi:hypothetical protein
MFATMGLIHGLASIFSYTLYRHSESMPARDRSALVSSWNLSASVMNAAMAALYVARC